jgi:hypothetical protein
MRVRPMVCTVRLDGMQGAGNGTVEVTINFLVRLFIHTALSLSPSEASDRLTASLFYLPVAVAVDA